MTHPKKQKTQLYEKYKVTTKAFSLLLNNVTNEFDKKLIAVLIKRILHWICWQQKVRINLKWWGTRNKSIIKKLTMSQNSIFDDSKK